MSSVRSQEEKPCLSSTLHHHRHYLHVQLHRHGLKIMMLSIRSFLPLWQRRLLLPEGLLSITNPPQNQPIFNTKNVALNPFIRVHLSWWLFTWYSMCRIVLNYQLLGNYQKKTFKPSCSFNHVILFLMPCMLRQQLFYLHCGYQEAKTIISKIPTLSNVC